MRIDVRRIDGVTVLVPHGKITIGLGDVALRDAVTEALAAGERSLLVDFHAVSGIDSAGIGELMAARLRTLEAGGRLKLCRLPAKIDEVLRVAHLVSVFDVFDKRWQAVGSFQTRSEA